MKILIVFVLAFAATLAVPSDLLISSRITGGVTALPGEFPFLVTIQHFFLGGGETSLINSL